MEARSLLESTNGFYAKKETTEHPSTNSECEETGCSECEVYRQKVAHPDAFYTTLLRKIISDQNCLLFQRVGIFVFSCLASLINFSRLEDFPIQQLYLENVFSALLYYLRYPTLRGAAEILIGGHLCWFFGFTTKDKELTVILMACLQTISFSLRCYGWAFMLIHLLFIYVVSYFKEILKVYYISMLIFPLVYEYFRQNWTNLTFCLEDLCLLSIALLGINYTQTEDASHCLAMESLLTAIIWILIKTVRTSEAETSS